MSFTLPRYFLRFHFNFTARTESTRAKNNHGYLFLAPKANTTKFTTASIPGDKPQKLSAEELLVVVGGGAAGVYGAIRAKTVASNLNVLVIEKGKLLSKVKISGGGRCNVTNGHCADNLVLADHYPRGNKELRGSFFNVHGPTDTMSWFVDKGVDLKTEDDGRVFPVSNNSSSVIDCLLSEAKCRGVSLQTGKLVTSASASASGKFLLKIEKRTLKSVELVEADYLLIASGSSQQGHNLAVQLGHSIVDPVPSLFTFKIEDAQLVELSGVGPMLVTHWGLSGPAILRLSAWGARYLYSSGYKGKLSVDFVPDLHVEDLKSMLSQQKNRFLKQKVLNSCPMELQLVKRFWKYILDREGLVGDTLWASVSISSIVSIANLLKHCTFEVKGKGQFKDEFVTAGGVPLSEIHLNTMESRIQPNLYFAGEVLNVDGVTGGFNFQNAWSGGYIAGSTIGRLAAGNANLVGAL
ncbi:putative ytfP [Gossypium arboreum]|uniref:Putative ytfP n=1 Tax=Gossypium arboreum TaxID=29729 RepID=A0A0B0P136_GOSAR|nr:putative ytfP [Gossypium arboreum]